MKASADRERQYIYEQENGVNLHVGKSIKDLYKDNNAEE
jgi:hypothetical protein